MITWSKYKKAGNLFSLLALQKDHAMVFKKGTPSVLSFKKLGKYRHTTVFKYCMIEHVYAYLVNTSLAKTAIFFQNNLYIFQLLTIVN